MFCASCFFSTFHVYYSQITIKRIERTKRKHVTAISGLEQFSIDLKKAAKQLAGKFATGSSVAKNPQGLEEVVVQGDVAEEVKEMIEKGEGVLKGIPVGAVKIVEDKKKATPSWNVNDRQHRFASLG